MFDIAIKKSFIISADMAHAVHPNYSAKHQSQHSPKLNNGIVIKTNFNQRYMTDGVSGSILRLLAKKAEVPVQEFVVRNDSPCGSTIGAYMASKVNAKTVDIGGT
jgi:aspartyl aminopeptidase